ncbi:MAG: hypothetical protein LAT57_10445 [Balneolales bacterium]|nr:hypothetical protein [Balneolales bacterium]
MYTAENQYYLNKLNRVMNIGASANYEVAYGIPGLWGRAMGLMLLINAVFTPYVLYLLFRLKKWNWLIYFCILMIIAVFVNSAIVAFFSLPGILSFSFIFLPLVLYMYLLRPKVSEWEDLAEYDAKIRRERMARRA